MPYQDYKRRMTDQFREICGNCGCTYGSHHGGTSPWPRDYCPDSDERMDWENGPGTVFKPTGDFKDEDLCKVCGKHPAHINGECIDCCH